MQHHAEVEASRDRRIDRLTVEPTIHHRCLLSSHTRAMLKLFALLRSNSTV